MSHAPSFFVSFTLEHYLIFHMHSSPTFNPTICQTFIAVHCTRWFTCADPSNVSFGPLAETHSPTGYEPKDFTEEDNTVLVKPMFFHRPSMTSTHDSAESIATLPPESDLDMIKYGICWLHRCTYRREKQVPTDHEFITLTEKTQCQVHLTSEKVQGNLPQCSHTRERNTFRQRRHFFRTSTGSRKRRNFLQVL